MSQKKKKKNRRKQKYDVYIPEQNSTTPRKNDQRHQQNNFDDDHERALPLMPSFNRAPPRFASHGDPRGFFPPPIPHQSPFPYPPRFDHLDRSRNHRDRQFDARMVDPPPPPFLDRLPVRQRIDLPPPLIHPVPFDPRAREISHNIPPLNPLRLLDRPDRYIPPVAPLIPDIFPKPSRFSSGNVRYFPPRPLEYQLPESSSDTSSESSDVEDIPVSKTHLKNFGHKNSLSDLIQPVPAREISSIQPFSEPPNSNMAAVRITSDQYILCAYLLKTMRSFGEKIRFAPLTYSTAFVEFTTSVAAWQFSSYINCSVKKNKILTHYRTDQIDPIELNEEIIQRVKDTDNIYDPPKVMIAHNITGIPKNKYGNYFDIPFQLTKKYELRGTSVITYHRNEASVKDFLAAFQQQRSSLPSTYVTEGIDSQPLIEQVLKLVTEKVVDSVMQDFNDRLLTGTFAPLIRKTRIKQRVQRVQYKSVSSTKKGMHLFLSSMPINVFLSPPPRRNIQDKIQQRLERMRSEMGEHDIMKVLVEQNTKVAIAQPELDGPCSRLAPIRSIEEKHKRHYLRPYAEERLRPFVKTRGNKNHFQESQFPPPDAGSSNTQGFGKRAYFEKSAIQGWGLFALETIFPDTLVAEYCGSLIRSRLADIFERRYIKRGLPHMYLFTIDDDWVVDATMRAGVARYYNHSCSPNCRANIVPAGSTKIISFYSKRLIHPHEELTFNYEMDFESDPNKWVKCYCGAPQCIGYLNYCQDESTRKKRELISQCSIDEMSDDEIEDFDIDDLVDVFDKT